MSKSRNRIFVAMLIVAGLAVAALTGCSQTQAPTSPATTPPQVGVSAAPGSPAALPGSPAASPGGQAAVQHKGKGVIKAIATDRMTATIDHEAIPSLPMEAMTMDYKMTTAKVLDGIKVGDSVDFVIVSGPDGYAVSTVKKAPK